MARIYICLVFASIACLAGGNANAQFINSIAEANCGIVLTGGSHYRFLDPEYDSKSIYTYTLNEGINVQQRVYSAEASYLEYPKLANSCEYIAVREQGLRI